MLQRVEELGLIDEAVNNFFVLSLPLESAKQPVPDDQNAGVVLVQAVAVGP